MQLQTIHDGLLDSEHEAAFAMILEFLREDRIPTVFHGYDSTPPEVGSARKCLIFATMNHYLNQKCIIALQLTGEISILQQLTIHSRHIICRQSTY